MTAQEALKTYFGYDSFRPGQDTVVSAPFVRADALAIMPTGAGKSLCYQIPALLLPGLTLVISPLISLMQDQVKGLSAAGIPAAYINSALTENQIAKALQLAAQGSYKIISRRAGAAGKPHLPKLCRVGRNFHVDGGRGPLHQPVGAGFRPSYLRILDFIDSLPRRPIVSAFTATATREVKDDIAQTLRLRAPEIVITGFDRPNLYYRVETTRRKDAFVADYVRSHPGRAASSTAPPAKNVDAVQEMLRGEDIPSPATTRA